MTKKITRGISKDFAEAFKQSELYKLYGEYKDELFIGVRNNYLNLYYNCDSIAKITFINGSIYCEIDKYYLGRNKDIGTDKQFKTEPKDICIQYEKIKERSNKKATPEKKAQSKLVLSILR